MSLNVEEFYATLEAAGEPAVREKYAQRAYGTDKRPLVEEWFRRKQAQRDSGREEVHIDLAKDANDIAKGSAKTARDAYRMSVFSVIVALVAALVATLVYLSKA
jgi:LPS sulfotransferase NodH